MSCRTGGCDGAMGDLDGDGDTRVECGGNDCDDSNPAVYGTAQEVCDADGVDEDCDPSTIRNATAGSRDGDADGDGYVSDECFNARADGGENRGDDCDDGSADIHPTVLDGCGGGDQDCDGRIDEDPDRTFYEDVDGDGYGIVSSTLTECSAPSGYAVMSGDCDDANRNINPARGEPCNGIDDDCSGVADDPVGGTCACSDGDTQRCGPSVDTGACTFGTSTCVAGAWGPCVGAVGPTAEVCNGNDDDCDGMTDDADSDIATGDRSVTGAFQWWRDVDGDMYGTSSMVRVACTRPAGYVATTAVADCQDMNAMVNPGRVEECNMIDDNCVMGVDEGCDCTSGTSEPCPTGSDVGDCARGTRTCSGGRWGSCVGAVGPSPEMCGGGDEDCDGGANDMDPEGATDASTWWRDMDGDGWGTSATTLRRCTMPSGYVAPRAESDCDDTTADANPGILSEAAFTCDMLDNDCDGTTDDVGTDMVTCYTDADGDSYGVTAGSVQRCHACPSGRVTRDGDCRDDIGAVNPGVTAFQNVAACPSGLSPVSCGLSTPVYRCGSCGGALAFWDYDCSGTVQTLPTGLECMLCSGRRGPTSGVAVSECGFDVTYTGGCRRSGATCFNIPDSTETLACR